MNAAQLRGLKRADLQKLCKERNIRGLTQKNEVLVKLLLESQSNSSPPAVVPNNEAAVLVSNATLVSDAGGAEPAGRPASDHKAELAQLRAEIDLLKPELYHALGQISHLKSQLKASITLDQCSRIVQEAVQHVRSDLQSIIDQQTASLREEFASKSAPSAIVQEAEPAATSLSLVLTPAFEEGQAQRSVDISYADTIEEPPSPSASIAKDNFVPLLEPTSIPLPPSPSMPSIAQSPDDTTLAQESPKQEISGATKASTPKTNSFFHQVDQASPLVARTATPKQQTTLTLTQSVKAILDNPFSKTPQSNKRSSLPMTAATVAIAVTPAGPKTMYGTERDENGQFGDLENKRGAGWFWKA